MSRLSEELKPCPFCGGKASLQKDGTSRIPCFIVQCECGASTPWVEDGDSPDLIAEIAVFFWNSRAPALESKPLSESRLVEAVKGLPAEATYSAPGGWIYCSVRRDSVIAVIRQQAIEAKQDVPVVSAEVMNAFFHLIGRAQEVWRLGAQTGPQWIKLGAALSQANAALQQPKQEDKS